LILGLPKDNKPYSRNVFHLQLNLHEADLFLILEPSFDMLLFVDLWFFPRYYQFLFVAIIELFCTDMKIKAKTI